MDFLPLTLVSLAFLGGCYQSFEVLPDGAVVLPDAAPARDAGTDFGPSTDPCAAFTDCTSCTEEPTCGFCSTDRRCHDGSSSGPTVGSCSGTWSWVTSECP